MTLGIDASNIRAGGGLRHLIELLIHVNISESSFHKVIVWSLQSTVDNLPDKDWLITRTHPLLNKSLIHRIIWQKFHLSKEAAKSCDLLFLPSGNTTTFHPYVSMCQNLLPFEPKEKKRYGLSFTRLRLELLKLNQCKSFTTADGTIFLSEYSLKHVKNVCGLICNTQVIPHGVSANFIAASDKKKTNATTKLLYVSIINMYKHQWNVVRAVYLLLDKGFDVELTLVGPSYAPALKRLFMAINERAEYRQKIKVVGKVDHQELQKYYKEADIFVFASSCETLGMIVIEAMAMGLPIASSNKSSMPEIIGEAGIYFDPEQPSDIASAIEKYIDNPVLITKNKNTSIYRAGNYSWDRSAQDTFHFLSNVLLSKKNDNK